MLENIISLLSTLIIIALILALAYLSTRFIASKSVFLGSGYKTRRIKIQEQITTGKDQKLMLVQMGQTIYFIASGPNGAVCIDKVSEQEAQLWQEEDEQKLAVQENLSFSDSLKKAAEQFNKKGRP